MSKEIDDGRIATSPAEARRMLGLGRTMVYKLISDGVLEARKSGRRLLISVDSIRNYYNSLPKVGPKKKDEAA